MNGHRRREYLLEREIMARILNPNDPTDVIELERHILEGAEVVPTPDNQFLVRDEADNIIIAYVQSLDGLESLRCYLASAIASAREAEKLSASGEQLLEELTHEVLS